MKSSEIPHYRIASRGSDIVGRATQMARGLKNNGDRITAVTTPGSASSPKSAEHPGFGRAPIGFIPKSSSIYRAYNSAAALVLLIMALPLCLIISVLLLITQGRPIFYSGSRIGKNGYHFDLFKFRTLDTTKAKLLTHDRVLPKGTGIETPMGLFLRETRLDELPQLFNVVRGDMNLCGPRPVRPEIAAANKADIPGYDVRFRVKPGLIGPAQALMSHGTSKAIRSRLNSQFCRTPLSYRGELSLVFIVAACVLARTATQLVSQLRPAAWRQKHNQLEQHAKTYDIRFEADTGQDTAVRWIDSDHIALVDDDFENTEFPTSGRLSMTLPGGQSRSLRVEIGTEPALADDTGDYHYYQPESEFGEHILSRYFFQSVVVPHHSEFLGSRLRRAFTFKPR